MNSKNLSCKLQFAGLLGTKGRVGNPGVGLDSLSRLTGRGIVDARFGVALLFSRPRRRERLSSPTPEIIRTALCAKQPNIIVKEDPATHVSRRISLSSHSYHVLSCPGVRYAKQHYLTLGEHLSPRLLWQRTQENFFRPPDPPAGSL